MQIEIGARMGYTDRAGTRGVERFMKHYYLTAKDVGDLTRIFCAALEAEHRRRPRSDLSRILPHGRTIGAFQPDGGRLTVRRTDKRSVGKECVSTCSARGSPQHNKKQITPSHT